MKTIYKNARLITPAGIVENAHVLIENGLIAGWGTGDVTDQWETHDLGGKYLAPGFIDIHVHGGGGYDFMEDKPEAITEAAKAHIAHGTTTLLPTSCTSSNESLFVMFDRYRKAKETLSDGARLWGIHLEGPYLNVKMKGAMQEHLLTDALPQYYEPVLERGGDLIARWTIAPEREGAFALGELLAKRGIVVSAGHTTASPALMREAAGHGFTLATHIYNAMTAMHKEGIFRLSGAAEGALASDAYDIEVVADGIHQPLEILNIAWRVKGEGRMALITDGTAISGCPVPPSGRSILAEREVLIEDGVAKLADRSAIAGSIATGDVLLKKAVAAGIPLTAAVTMLTAAPARIIGADKLGKIEKGALADLVVLDDELSVVSVLKEGRAVK